MRSRACFLWRLWCQFYVRFIHDDNPPADVVVSKAVVADADVVVVDAAVVAVSDVVVGGAAVVVSCDVVLGGATASRQSIP